MIRLVAVAALALLAAPVRAGQPAPPEPPAAPAKDAPRPPKVYRFQFEVPDFPDLGFSELEELAELPGLAVFDTLFAQARPDARDAGRKARRAPPPDPDADDEGDGGEEVQNDKGVRVYRMNRDRARIVVPRLHLGDEDEMDEREATAQARGRGAATLPVKGPVTFQVRAQAGDVEVVTADRPQVSVTVSDAPAEEVALHAFGDRVEPSFRGRRLLRHGKLHVELPRGSRLDVTTMSGDVSVQRVADVRVRTLSGDVKLAAVAKSEVQSISGDVHIDDSSGPVRLHLVSGRATVQTSGAAPQLEFQSASGSLDWGGLCAKDCHLSAETVSGEVRLAVDPRSSFELSYSSHNGELRDEANLSVKRAPRRKSGMASGFLEATFGQGEGVIEANAFSGNLLVKKK